MPAIHYKEIDFAQLFFFDNYVISQFKEGVLLESTNYKILIKALEDHYQDKPFVYIANRAFAYNVSPMIYREASNMDKLKGVCIVTSKTLSQDTARFEGKFYDKEFYVCGTIADGINWALRLLQTV
jgi:thymidine kinase